MTGEERNRIAVRAMAVTAFNAPIRRSDGGDREKAIGEIVATMEGRWPVQMPAPERAPLQTDFPQSLPNNPPAGTPSHTV
jgi:hypothetical protein